MLFNEFVSSYQVCHQDPSLENLSSAGNEQKDEAFVYVDHEGGVRYITDVVASVGGDDEIFALSMGQDGEVEFLAFQS